MKVYLLEKSVNPKKKFTAIRVLPSIKHIMFGDSAYEDYTHHKDGDRKNAYLMRHKSTENWNNTDTAGFWSRWLLWNKKTLDASIKDIEDKFEIKIVKVF
jgi:hypothetical protein